MPLVRASTHASHVYEEKYAEAFSPMGTAELWAVSRHKALRAKNLVSTRFFTLPKHAGALQCVGIVNEKFVKTISR